MRPHPEARHVHARRLRQVVYTDILFLLWLLKRCRIYTRALAQQGVLPGSVPVHCDAGAEGVLANRTRVQQVPALAGRLRPRGLLAHDRLLCAQGQGIPMACAPLW